MEGVEADLKEFCSFYFLFSQLEDKLSFKFGSLMSVYFTRSSTTLYTYFDMFFLKFLVILMSFSVIVQELSKDRVWRLKIMIRGTTTNLESKTVEFGTSRSTFANFGQCKARCRAS